MTRHRSPDRRYFDGFAEQLIDTGDAQIFARSAGNGPAVLLLHGHPRTSGTWHGVARQLLESGFAVVCPDLRGYGGRRDRRRPQITRPTQTGDGR